MNTRTDWLRERKQMLTASDIAAILGEHPHKTNIDVYIDKTTDDISQDDEDHLKFGRDVEGAIANLYETRTGNEVIDLGSTVISKHQDIDWLGATLDRKTVIDGVEVPLELKHVGGFVKMQEWQDEPPTHYQIQCQIQCACERDEFASLAGMFPGYQLGQSRIEYSQDFFDAIFPMLDEFWNHNVKRKIPPELIPHKLGLDSVKKLYPKENGETIALDDECMDIVKDLEDFKSELRSLKKSVNLTETILREKMGNATYGALPDGRFVTLKTTERKGHVVAPSTFRTLRISKNNK